MRRLDARYLAALFAFWVVGCLPIWEANKLQDRVDKLESQQNSMEDRLEREKQKLKTMISDAQGDVEELRSVLEEARNLLQRNNADLGAEMQEVRREVQKLRGMVEETQFRMRKLEQSLELFKEDVEMRFQEGGVPGDLPEEADKLYSHAQKKLDEEKWRAARRAFEKFLSEYGDDDRADDARYFIGETRFREEKWVTAVVEYRKVLQNYDDSNRLADATYKIGVAFTKLGKCKNAKPFFETIGADYPASKFASKAEEKVQAIESGRCPDG